jgi:tetratricopeptide (TPR) repeat protein
LNPSFASARGYYGVALAYCGRWEEGDRAARHALRLSPRDPFAAVYYGVASYCQFVGGNYEEAISLSRESLRLRSDFVGGHRVLTAAAAMTKQRELATASLKALLRVQPGLSLKWLATEMPFKGDNERDQYVAAFRWAGLE